MRDIIAPPRVETVLSEAPRFECRASVINADNQY